MVDAARLHALGAGSESGRTELYGLGETVQKRLDALQVRISRTNLPRGFRA